MVTDTHIKNDKNRRRHEDVVFATLMPRVYNTYKFKRNRYKQKIG